MEASVAHLHTYFLFPFAIDKDAVLQNHGDLWTDRRHWMHGLDRWIGAHAANGFAVPSKIGIWKRCAYTRFDLDSQAYADMVFFHPFVRRIFFDTVGMRQGDEEESLLRCYSLGGPGTPRLTLAAEDAQGRSAEVEITDLRLFLFANGIGILSLGIEAENLPVQQALWVNEMMRKVYASSGRQRREGRTPSSIRLLSGGGTVVSEEFQGGGITGFLPPLSKIITSLLYFTDYDKQEYEPVLDERMIVYSYVALDPDSLPPNFTQTEDYEILFSRMLYVDHLGEGYRYEPHFIRDRMKEHVYRRWAHQGTLYGFTSYSNLTLALGTFDCDQHLLREGFLIHRMFNTRYYLMAVVALFYRATVLDFSEQTALVSKRLYRNYADGIYSADNIATAGDLRSEFLHFSNYWHFDELANKDEEIEHFEMQCKAYRIAPMQAAIERELEKLNATLSEYYFYRNTDAVNRLAIVSMLLGAGAVATGFFGMNFGRGFANLFFQPSTNPWPHLTAIIVVTVLAFGALSFAVYLIAANWVDYKAILVPQSLRRPRKPQSLRR